MVVTDIEDAVAGDCERTEVDTAGGRSAAEGDVWIQSDGSAADGQGSIGGQSAACADVERAAGDDRSAGVGVGSRQLGDAGTGDGQGVSVAGVADAGLNREGICG